MIDRDSLNDNKVRQQILDQIEEQFHPMINDVWDRALEQDRELKQLSEANESTMQDLLEANLNLRESFESLLDVTEALQEATEDLLRRRDKGE